jgi:hypothetical protein
MYIAAFWRVNTTPVHDVKISIHNGLTSLNISAPPECIASQSSQLLIDMADQCDAVSDNLSMQLPMPPHIHPNQCEISPASNYFLLLGTSAEHSGRKNKNKTKTTTLKSCRPLLVYPALSTQAINHCIKYAIPFPDLLSTCGTCQQPREGAHATLRVLTARCRTSGPSG